MTELVPILEKLFPKEDFPNQSIHEVSPLEGEERTLRLVRGFLSSVPIEDRPLVLFIDDFQWSSAAEASLLSSLISSFSPRGLVPTVRNCFLVLSYRVNEVPKDILDTLNEGLDGVKSRNNPARIHEIQVGPLHLVRCLLCFSP